jgi:hypothetical protein
MLSIVIAQFTKSKELARLAKWGRESPVSASGGRESPGNPALPEGSHLPIAAQVALAQPFFVRRSYRATFPNPFPHNDIRHATVRNLRLRGCAFHPPCRAILPSHRSKVALLLQHQPHPTLLIIPIPVIPPYPPVSLLRSPLSRF